MILRLIYVWLVRKDFWQGVVQNTGVWTVGEVLDNRTSYVGDYTSQSATVLWHGEHRVDFDCETDFLDGLLDYPAYFAPTPAS
jgi:hypothetical protein